jgi:hypothetical protein
MVPKLHLIVVAATSAGGADGGGITWFPWVALIVVGIGLGIAGVLVRKDDPENGPERVSRDDDTGESPVVHRPPPAAAGSTAKTGDNRSPPRPPPKPSRGS